MADRGRMLHPEGASCEEGGRRKRETLPERTKSGTRIITGRDNREKAQAAAPGAQEQPGRLSDSAQRQRKHRAKAAEELCGRARAREREKAHAREYTRNMEKEQRARERASELCDRPRYGLIQVSFIVY